jgi:hypothetical protein
MSDDENPVVVLRVTWRDEEDGEMAREVIGVFGPYESEFEAGKHVGIMRDPEMRGRMRSELLISTSQLPLEDPSAFTERVEELLGG